MELHKRSGRYFVYAAGEILLIMVGILLALQVQMWNEKRLLRIEEGIILGRISEELEKAIQLISGILRFWICPETKDFVTSQ